jgi:hypothetical protein
MASQKKYQRGISKLIYGVAIPPFASRIQVFSRVAEKSAVPGSLN